MAKLVVLSAGLAGRTHELKVDKTTIGRVEDNTFQIAESSVSSHHCEILMRGVDVVVKDLNSTNGTFINNEKVSESVLKPGQVLRLGQIELRLEDPSAGPSGSAPTAAPSPADNVVASRNPTDKAKTVSMQRGVSLTDLEQGPRTSGFDTSSKAFSKKSNKVNKWFLIAGICAIVVIGFVLIFAYLKIGH